MDRIAWIAVFGAAGAVARYSVSGWMYRLLGDSFPYGTLAVNLIGCLLLGAVAQVSQTTELIPAELRSAITIGLCGAFTTFSTFGYDTLKLLEDGQWSTGLLNVLISVLLGLLAVWLGVVLAEHVYGGIG